MKEVVRITDKTDPRPARSRARLLEAATALLRAGGPSAVTVDAVTRGANVARATLYRHFPSGNELLAAAFSGLIPPAPMPSEGGSLRDRLIAVVLAFGQSIAEAPGMVTAMSWLALGRDLEQLPESRQTRTADTPRLPRCASGSPSSTRRRSTRSSTALRPPNWAISTARGRLPC